MLSVLAVLTIISALLAVWQWVAAWRFPLNARIWSPQFTPPVTVLKPVKGWDSHSADCLRSWLNQTYPADVQVLIGIASENDPAAKGVGSLLEENQAWNARLIMCPKSFGTNAKVSTLVQLFPLAEHDVIVVSDADVRAQRDYLVNALAPLANPDIGLVNSFYRLAHLSTLAMQWEAIAINADFWSQVLQGKTLQPLDFALGAVMVTRREQLKAIGGFEALADYLADDFQLGNRIVQTGKSVAICPVVVDCLSSPTDWSAVWKHQLRWSRTIRVSKPLPYAFSILSNATLWPLLLLVAHPSFNVALAFGILIIARVSMAATLQNRLAPNNGSWRYCWLAPVKDIMQFTLWLLAFCGNRIEWRGQIFRLMKNGKLTRS